jgi:cytochrome bd-type quinol oxidase subunit 1
LAVAASAAFLFAACLAISSTAVGATVIHFEPESVAALEGQLHHAQVHALSVHPAAGTGHIHVSLNDGRHMTVAYASAEEAHLLAIARADGTPVVIAKAKAKQATKAAHHKLRYIAAGILVIVIIVVAAVLLIDRRRKLGEAGGDEASEGPSVPSSQGETP